MRAFFIINPNAGSNRGRGRWEALRAQLERRSIRADHAFTASPGDGIALARKAAVTHERVVAVGGDGTASEVADGILCSGSETTSLGIVPFGTGNDFAVSVGLHTEAAAIESLLSGKTRTIDVIEVHCESRQQRIVRHALLFAGVGIICEALKKTNGVVKRLFGQGLAYPAGLAWALCSYRSPTMHITCDSASYHQQFLFAGASNTEIAGGGMKLAPGAKIDDGQLNINLVEALGTWQALQQLGRLRRGQHISHPAVRYVSARRLEVAADEPLEVAVDGELIGQTPARFVVRAKALRVCVP